MKHTLLLFFLLFACTGYAQNEVELIDKHSGMEGTPRHNEASLPKVTYDDNTVSVADSLSRVAEIVIKDTDGETVYQSVSILSPDTTLLYYAPEGTDNLYTIDLYIEDEEYYGYFE